LAPTVKPPVLTARDGPGRFERGARCTERYYYNATSRGGSLAAHEVKRPPLKRDGRWCKVPEDRQSRGGAWSDGGALRDGSEPGLEMNHHPTGIAPEPARWGQAMLLAAAGIVGLSIALPVLLDVAGPPPYVRELLGSRVSSPAAALIALAMLWLGAGAAWLAKQFLERPWLAAGLPLWAAGMGLVALALLHFAMVNAAGQTAAWDVSTLGPSIVASGSVALMLLIGSTAVGAVSTTTWETASKYVMFLLLAAAPWIALSIVAFPGVVWAGGTLGRMRAEPWLGGIGLLMLVLALGANAAALGHTLRKPSRRRLLLVLAVTCLLVPVGWFLANLAVASRWPGPEAMPSPLQAILSGESALRAPDGELFLRWSVVQVLAVLALAWGHWVALLGSARYESAIAARPEVRRREPSAPAALAVLGRPGRAYRILAVVYGVFVVYGSLVPLDFKYHSFDKALSQFLKTPYLLLHIWNRADLVANLLLYIPLTFFAMGALTREGRRPGRGLVGLCVVIAGCALAVAVEFAQIFFPPRTVSLNDILAEAVGSVVGVGLWILFGQRLTAWVRRLGRLRNRRRLAIHILTGYVVALAVYELYPFDFVLSMDELLEELRGGKLHVMPLADWDHLSLLAVAVKAGVLVPVGYLCALTGFGRGRLPRIAAIGGLFALAVQCLHVFIYTRWSSTTDVLLGALGAAAGGWLASRFGPVAGRPVAQTPLWRAVSWSGRLALAIGGAAAILWYKWQPFAWQWPKEGVLSAAIGWVRIPFYCQYYNTEFQATLQVTQDFGAPLILALLLTSVLGKWGTAGRWVAGITAGGIAAAAEAGQMFFPPRVPDLTTMMIAGVGAAVGVFLHDRFVHVFVKAHSVEDEPDGPWSPT